MSRSWQNLLNQELGLTDKKNRINTAKRAKAKRREKKGKKVESYGYKRIHQKNQTMDFRTRLI
jgi:hypothetical protein